MSSNIRDAIQVLYYITFTFQIDINTTVLLQVISNRSFKKNNSKTSQLLSRRNACNKKPAAFLTRARLSRYQIMDRNWFQQVSYG